MINGTKECLFTSIADSLLEKRDRVVKALAKKGMVAIVPEGGYFIMVDISNVGKMILLIHEIMPFFRDI